jgi:hypothetical protein
MGVLALFAAGLCKDIRGGNVFWLDLCTIPILLVIGLYTGRFLPYLLVVAALVVNVILMIIIFALDGILAGLVTLLLFGSALSCVFAVTQKPEWKGQLKTFLLKKVLPYLEDSTETYTAATR